LLDPVGLHSKSTVAARSSCAIGTVVAPGFTCAEAGATVLVQLFDLADAAATGLS